MSLTLERLSADICQQVSPSRNGFEMPAELLTSMLDTLSSRQLLQVRSTSPQFACSVDYLLRCRMLALVNSKDYQVMFSAHAPLETRPVQRQLLLLTHFDRSSAPGASETACFKFAADPALPQFLPLDDEEYFSTHMLSIHFQAVPPPLPSPPLTPEPGDSAPLPPFRASAFAGPRKPSYGFSLSLGSAHPRLFRSWFEDASLATKCTETQEMSGRRSPPSAPRTVSCAPPPMSSSALLSATLLCNLETPSPPPPSSTLHGHYFSGRAYTPTPPRLFEFEWSQVTVDVGRFVVGAEEGLGWSTAQKRVMVLFR